MALVGVLAVGLLEGIVLAIALSLLLILARVVRPHDAVLAQAPGMDGYHDREEFPQGETLPGLLVYRFDAPLFFANADHFQRRVRELVAEAPEPVEWLLLDAEAITDIDSTAGAMLESLRSELAEGGVTLVIARAKFPLRQRMGRLGLLTTIGAERFYASIRSAVAAYAARPR